MRIAPGRARTCNPMIRSHFVRLRRRAWCSPHSARLRCAQHFTRPGVEECGESAAKLDFFLEKIPPFRGVLSFWCAIDRKTAQGQDGRMQEEGTGIAIVTEVTRRPVVEVDEGAEVGFLHCPRKNVRARSGGCGSRGAQCQKAFCDYIATIRKLSLGKTSAPGAEGLGWRLPANF